MAAPDERLDHPHAGPGVQPHTQRNGGSGRPRSLGLRPNINPAQVGIVGHSEGGIVAAMVAAEAPEEVRFIVMLAGTGLPGIEIKSLQDAAARRADGMPEPLGLLNQTQERELYEIAASKRDLQDAILAMSAATDALPAEVKTTLEIPPEGLPAQAFEGWTGKASEYFLIEETVAPSVLAMMSTWMKTIAREPAAASAGAGAPVR